MRILLANDTYYPNKNGSSYFTQRLAFYLQKRGNEVLVIAPSPTIHQGFYSYNNIRIFGIRSLPILFYKNFRFCPLIIKKAIRKVIKEFEPDVIHIQGHFLIPATVLTIGKKLGIPSVGTNHFMPDNLTPYLHLPNEVDNILHKLAWKHFSLVFNKLDFVTTPTQSAADVLRKNGFKKEVHPVSNGIDLERFNPKNNGEYLKKQYSLVPGKPILLFVGRLDAEKNIDWVLQALPSVLREIDIQFVIVGTGTQEKNLKSLAEKLGILESVIFAGFVKDSDLPNIYAIADCFVIAGTVELQCLVAMEAMATGVPVVAANALALPELIKDGENGYLFKPGDIKGLASALLKIFKNKKLRDEMGERSLEIIRKHDIEKTIDKYEEIYKSLLPIPKPH